MLTHCKKFNDVFACKEKSDEILGLLFYAVKQFLMHDFFLATTGDAMPADHNASRLSLAFMVVVIKKLEEQLSLSNDDNEATASMSANQKSVKTKNTAKRQRTETNECDVSASVDDESITKEQLLDAKIIIAENKLRKLKRRRLEIDMENKNKRN